MGAGLIRVLLVDDQQLVRAGFRSLLRRDREMTVVAEAGTGDEAVRAVREHRPDVTLMDIRMPGMDGIAATEALHPLTARSAVVILSFRDDAATRARALAAGAFAYVAKHEASERLLTAIRQAAWAPEQPRATG